LPVRSLTTDLEVGFGLKESAEAFTDDAMIISYNDRNHMVSITFV